MAKPTRHYGMWRIRWLDEDGRRHSEVYEKRDEAVLSRPPSTALIFHRIGRRAWRLTAARDCDGYRRRP